jgi:hypothetical protein
MDVCCVLTGRGLCDELITRPEESYRLCCVVVCDLETSRMRRPWPALGRSATAKKNLLYITSTHSVISDFLPDTRVTKKITHYSGLLLKIYKLIRNLPYLGFMRIYIKVDSINWFKVCKSVHHRTIQINHQPDAAIFKFIILTFIYSSKCFGSFPTHYQELMTAVAASGFTFVSWW